MNFKGTGEIVIDLNTLVEQMEPVEGYLKFLNIRTGHYVSVNEQCIKVVERIEGLQDLFEYQEFEREEIMNILDIEENFEDYEALPTKFDLDEYSIMEDFIETLKDNKFIERLEEAIIGKGALRRFKDTITSLGLSNAWYSYRNQVFFEIAKSWCEERNLAYRIGKSEIDR